jgi:hypothetical protein
MRETTGRDLIIVVSVDEPLEPQDELHFLKLVSWCYVFLMEASEPPLRHILSLLRTANREDFRTARRIVESVNHLRTVRVHNLSSESESDQYKKRQAEIWLALHGGDPLNWGGCCSALCAEVASAVEIVGNKWRNMAASEEDAQTAIRDLLAAVDREWPPYVFDRMVEGAAIEIGLKGLDCVKYREGKLDQWRRLVTLFETSEHAHEAVNSAIRIELEQVFGNFNPVEPSGS